MRRKTIQKALQKDLEDFFENGYGQDFGDKRERMIYYARWMPLNNIFAIVKKLEEKCKRFENEKETLVRAYERGLR